MLVDQFGFDFYLNGVIINLPDLAIYFFYTLVIRIKRRQYNMAASMIALVSSFLLIFLHTKQICTGDCWSARVLFELLVIFVMRIFVAFLFQLLYVYLTELYPVQVVGLGIGLGSIVGLMPVVFIPELINVLDRANFPVMVLFCVFACLCFWGSYLLEETHGRPPKDKIKEVVEATYN